MIVVKPVPVLFADPGDLLQQRAKSGGTVILTTHILDVAERMANRIGIIQHGRLLAEGTLDELRGTPSLQKMVVLKKGSRLSVQPATEAEFEAQRLRIEGVLCGRDSDGGKPGEASSVIPVLI